MYYVFWKWVQRTQRCDFMFAPLLLLFATLPLKGSSKKGSFSVTHCSSSSSCWLLRGSQSRCAERCHLRVRTALRSSSGQVAWCAITALHIAAACSGRGCPFHTEYIFAYLHLPFIFYFIYFIYTPLYICTFLHSAYFFFFWLNFILLSLVAFLYFNDSWQKLNLILKTYVSKLACELQVPLNGFMRCCILECFTWKL